MLFPIPADISGGTLFDKGKDEKVEGKFSAGLRLTLKNGNDIMTTSQKFHMIKSECLICQIFSAKYLDFAFSTMRLCGLLLFSFDLFMLEP